MFSVLPLLADMLNALLDFVAPVWAVTEGRGVAFTGTLGMVASIFRVLANLVLSRVMTSRNAHRLLRAGFVGMGVAIGFGALVIDPRWMFLIVMAMRISAACFFAPYQMVMHSGKARPLGQTVAIYNIAWMLGYFAGPGLGGVLMRVSRRLVHIAGALLAWVGYHLAGHAVARERAEGRNPAIETFDSADSQVRKRGRDFYIWIGWASLFVHGYSTGTVFYVFPKLGHERGFSGFEIGMAESLCMAAMILAVVFALGSRRWLYNPALTVLAGLLGAGAVGVVALTHSYAANIGGLLLLGLSGGINCFVSIYYANNHTDRSNGISINEAAVGTGSILGPAVGALLGGGEHPTLTPYWVALGVYLALGAGAVAMHCRGTRAASEE
jgi:MFS family permease